MIAIKELENDGYKIDKETFQEFVRYFNVIGGIMIIDYFSTEELIEKIKNHYYSIY